MTWHFQNYNAETAQETNQEMSYLLKILPSTLKTQLAKFLYQDAILANRFLQDRDDNFYNKYLEELKTAKFVKNDVITKIGNVPESVYFIMGGVVHNQTTGRYLEAGSMLNHDYVYLDTEIAHNCVADSEFVIVLKFERETFELIIKSFSDMQQDLE